MIKFLLSLFVPFRWLIEKMGADYDQFISILRIKLILDDRRANKFSKKKGNEQGKKLILQTIFQIFMGIFFASFVIFIKSPFTYYYFSHTFIMVMMAMMIISEFTTILFDTAENAIIQPLPIKGNTINLARNTHIFLYLLMMAFNLSVFSFIVACFKFGVISAFIFLFTIVLNVLFTLFFTNILYLGIMHIASGERLKNMLMYFQIVIAIFFMAAYQIGLKMVDRSIITEMILPIHWYTYLAPPAFFSGLTEAISTLTFDSSHFIFIAESLIVPALAIFLTVKYLTPVFNRKLMDLEQGDRVSKVKTENHHISLYFKIMSLLFVNGQEEKAAFKMMWKMTGRERQFKQSFLPAIGYIFIMILAPYIGKNAHLSELIKGDSYLLILYIFLFIAVALCNSLLIGSNQAANWMFKSMPLSSPADFFKGAIKATFARFLVPFYAGLGTLLCCIWGIKILPDVIIAFMYIYLLTLIIYFLQQPGFPFSLEKTAVQGGSNAMKIFGLIALTVPFGFLHKYLLHSFPFANLLLIPVYVGAILYVNRIFVYRRITWKAVDRVNNYS